MIESKNLRGGITKNLLNYKLTHGSTRCKASDNKKKIPNYIRNDNKIYFLQFRLIEAFQQLAMTERCFMHKRFEDTSNTKVFKLVSWTLVHSRKILLSKSKNPELKVSCLTE